MPLIAETCNLLCVLLFPDDLDTLCLALKALHVQEERDRLRLEFNELEERVNPNSTFFFCHPWCVVCPRVLFPVCLHQHRFGVQIPLLLIMRACVCVHVSAQVFVHTWSTAGRQCHPSTNTPLPFYLGVFHASPQQQQTVTVVECMSNMYTYFIFEIYYTILDFLFLVLRMRTAE